MHGAAVGTPILTTSDSDYVVADSGDTVWVLYRAVKGEPSPMSKRFGGKYREYAFKFGAAIAKLHEALTNIDTDIDVADMDLFRHVTEWALPKANVSDDISREYISEFGEICAKLPMQLIHRDTHPENIMWSGGEVGAILRSPLSPLMG